MSVNRTELVGKIAQRANITRAQADAAIGAFQGILADALEAGESVKITGLMSVERTKHAAREVANPRNREEKIQIPAGYSVRIKAGSALKKAVGK